jgi:putative ABC transport system permease protein
MLFNYLKIAIRSIKRYASYTVINISGLALGITCALLIFSLVSYHLSFDNFHNQSERTYRFVTEQHRDDITYVGSVPPVFGKAFRDDYTYGEKVARLFTSTEELISIEEDGKLRKFKEDIAFAEPEFFEIFNFPLVSGQSGGNLLQEPNTVLISERIAAKFFGNEQPIGKVIRFDNRIEFKVAGLLKPVPDNTDFRSEIYFSYSTIKQYNEWYAADDSWGGITGSIQTFVRLQPGVNPAEVEPVLQAYVKKFRAENKNVHHYKLQPLDDIHFNEQYGGRIGKNTLWAVSVIGFFLVFTACLNFINLATAQAINRSREVGVRKTLGSARMQLFWQFTTETGLIVLIASVLAFSFAYAVLPFVNSLLETRLTLDIFSDIRLAAFLMVLMVIVTLLSCSYPGLILSGFKPALALKGKLSDQKTSSFNVRRGLIITQFTISQVLLIGLIVIVYQMRYFKESDLGFNQDAVIMIPVGSTDHKLNTLKNQFSQIPHVQHVSLCYAAPASDGRWGTSFRYDNRSEAEVFSVSYKGADENFLSTFDIDLVAGRNLMPSDTVREFLVNEKLVSKLGLKSPEDILGKTVMFNGDSWKGPVVGVVSDFHDLALRAEINPIFMTTSLEDYNAFAVKIDMKDAAATLATIEKTWSDMYPDLMYEYDFLNEQTAEFYEAENTMLSLVQVFSGIALFIGCMGLYGLVSFMAVQRTKEIGIRKVLGGTISHILWIFGKEFSRLVIIAFLIAAPLAWWIMSQWLENYVYRIDFTIWFFVLELTVISVIVLVTVGYQSLRAALMSPVNSLRTE